MEHYANKTRYDEMIYQRCGRSGIKLPAISLGLWHNFGSVDIYENSKAIIFEAFDKGITHFDLANNYGPEPGSAEENFGSILNKHLKAYRDEMIISTKAGYYMWPGPYGEWGSRKNLLASLDQSLKRMNLEYVDIFYSHRFDPETPLEETMKALDHAVRQGKALYAGISNYPADKTREAESILRELGTPCLIHQARYSMFERWVEPELLDVLDKRGMGLIAFSPLAQGLLTNRYINGIPEGSRMSKNHFLKQEHLSTEKLEAIKKLNSIAQLRGQSLAQMAIAWLLKDPRVTSVLVGASSVKQLNDNLGTLTNIEFSREELNEIESILKF
ncbi:L-glyceraldehyde 3-phosphate reductase [Plebeiibacterium sediminum]|uniref:L-glyceraldehyde 3-phosphate reductase n=1 Tax=Plebeiibacterium sediminum TaxID=2992112 RepID=A0AAE3M372_9BACT|nr:L-glyceraldehyde 3-phosphate reductase [Plebeiobacterium sediminum]MCW3786263.1 L-glyceraldehyde 3-phosphate reductase [Plebeiobacterium sediminum]